MPSTFVVKGEALKELLQSDALIVEVTISSALRQSRDRAAHSTLKRFSSIRFLSFLRNRAKVASAIARISLEY